MPHTSRNCTDRQSQADSIIITLLGGERALMHMHAKHRCRTECRRADHQIRTLGPCKQANKNRANHPPSPRLYSAAQLPSGQSLLAKQDLLFVKQGAPTVAQTSAVAVSIACLHTPCLDTNKSQWQQFLRDVILQKKKGSSIPPQDDDTFRCYHGCLIA